MVTMASNGLQHRALPCLAFTLRRLRDLPSGNVASNDQITFPSLVREGINAHFRVKHRAIQSQQLLFKSGSRPACVANLLELPVSGLTGIGVNKIQHMPPDEVLRFVPAQEFDTGAIDKGDDAVAMR